MAQVLNQKSLLSIALSLVGLIVVLLAMSEQAQGQFHVHRRGPVHVHPSVGLSVGYGGYGAYGSAYPYYYDSYGYGGYLPYRSYGGHHHHHSHVHRGHVHAHRG